MTLLKGVRGALRLLSSKDKRKLAFVTVAQATTSLLDIAGVLLLGLVGALAVTTVQGTTPPAAVEAAASTVGLGSLSSGELLALLAAIAAGLLLGKSVISSYLLRRIFLFLASRQASVSAQLAGALLSRPLTFLQQRSSQQTAYALVQGAGSAILLMIGQAVIFVSELSLIVVLGVLLLMLDPLLAMAAIAFFGLVAFLLQLALGRWALQAGQGLAATDISSLDLIQESMNAYREITVADRRDLYVWRIQQLRWTAAKHSADLQFISTLPKYVYEVALVLGSFALAGVLFATEDSVNAVGTLALFLVAATRIMPSLLRLQGAAITMRNAEGTASMTLDLAQALDVSADTAVRASAPPLQRPQDSPDLDTFVPRIALSEVSFTYPGGTTPAIRGVTLEASPGSSVALVGASGAGKSTLADIILGVLEPQSGRVTIGSVAPANAVRKWPGAIAYVPQDVALANGTIRANVALGLPRDDVEDSLVWEALERAHLSEALESGREGLDTLIGERGVRLSGGQRQRLGIARALYTRPKLLVMDEATSSLDAETESAITQTVKALEGEVTTIVIAHRLSTVRAADLVAYLENGALVASGDFEEVRQRIPAFDRQAQLMGLGRSPEWRRIPKM